MLGHSSIKTTQIYAKVVQSKLSKEMIELKERMSKQQTLKIANAKCRKLGYCTNLF
jgi:hypothetical protein